MHCRFIFVFFVFLYAELGNANDSAWNCEKTAGKEWNCADHPSSDAKENSSIVPSESDSSELNSTELTPTELKPTELNQVPPISLPVLAPVLVPEKPKAVSHPPPTVTNRTGWTCAPNEEDETWNCGLIGVDPKGETREVRETVYASGWLGAAFDPDQEQIFKTLHSQLKYDPWENCTASSRRVQQYSASKDRRDNAPMDVTADYSEIFDKEITSFFGNVDIVRADQNIKSDRASYDTVSETMDAQGHVFYNEDELSLYSDTALLNLATDEARLRNSLFISPSAPIRGSADVVYRDSKFLSRYKNAAFTSCRPGNQDWVVHAERLKMNKLTGKAAAKNAWIEFKGLPVLYTPYISFPLDDRRLSGILPPTFGSSDENGFDMRIPYYWNIAPNYDLTFWPRYMSKRGGMLGGDFRYLTEMTKGSVGLEFLPYDTLRKESRYSGAIKNQTQFSSSLNSYIDLNYVSDKEYFDELNNALGISNNRYLRSQANLNYKSEGILFATHLEAYQTIDNNIADSVKPYLKLPQVTLNLDHSFEEWPVDLEMENEYVFFYRNGRVNGQRFNTKPSISFPIETSATFFKPKASLQYTEYFLQDQPSGTNNTISRTLPIFSVDSGLFFERDFNLFDSSFQHTIEPRAFYLYIPKRDQSDIPLFDSSLYDFNFNSMFRENRFSGTDRIQDANQLTVAMTSRLIDSETGQERLNLSVGEIFYFTDREVTLLNPLEPISNPLRAGFHPETNSTSNLVAELSGQLTDHLSFSSGIQWDPDVNEFTRGQAEIRFRNNPDQIVNIGYRYRRDNINAAATIIQTDASFRWPIYDNWYGVGRWQYSLKFNSTKESFLGLEKESCCWRFRVIWRRFANTITGNVAEDKMDEGVFVQLELKGLTSFGDKVDEFLEKNLKGYQRVK